MNGDLNLDLLRQFGTAVLIGALVGIDREKRKSEGESALGGIRTFILLALAGATAAYVARVLDSPGVFLAALIVAGVAVVASYVGDLLRPPAAGLGLTSEMAALVVLLLGGVCVLGHLELAVALGVATSAVLAFKQPIHEVVRKVGTDDLYAGLKLLIATFIVLPLLPRRAVDPWGALNPYTLWLLVILISGLSLVGYVATRWLGTARGILLTGITGGLVSSTAVTLALARRSREPAAPPGQSHTLAAGILTAWLVMVVRIEVLLLIANPDMARRSLLPLGVIALATAGAAAWLLLVHRQPSAGPGAGVTLELKNPFSLTAAIQFAALFAGVLLLVKLVQQYSVAGGVYAVALVAGVPDVDPVSLSMADYARTTSRFNAAIQAVLLAIASNTVVKTGLAMGAGHAGLRRPMLLGAGMVLAATAVAWFLV